MRVKATPKVKQKTNSADSRSTVPSRLSQFAKPSIAICYSAVKGLRPARSGPPRAALRQRLLQVRLQVCGVLDPDRDAHQPVRDAQRCPLLRAERAVRGHRRV